MTLVGELREHEERNLPGSHELLHELGRGETFYGDRGPILSPLENLSKLESLQVILKMTDMWQFGGPDPSPCAYAACSLAHNLADLQLPATLTRLDLDLSGVPIFARFTPRSECDHTCVTTNGLLNKCRHLQIARLRLACLCPKVFAEKPEDGTLALQVLCLQCDTNNTGDFRRSWECGEVEMSAEMNEFPPMGAFRDDDSLDDVYDD